MARSIRIWASPLWVAILEGPHSLRIDIAITASAVEAGRQAGFERAISAMNLGTQFFASSSEASGLSSHPDNPKESEPQGDQM